MTAFKWVHVNTKEEAKLFYESLLPKIREAAKECGYAIGVHGSQLRDLDLIAVPWVADCADKEVLVRKIHQSACGIESATYDWEDKPHGRIATCFPICWTEWNEANAGHIDLSMFEKDLKSQLAKVTKERDELIKMNSDGCDLLAQAIEERDEADKLLKLYVAMDQRFGIDTMTEQLCEAQARITQLSAENMHFYNTLQSITEDGHTDCEWCQSHEALAKKALTSSPSDALAVVREVISIIEFIGGGCLMPPDGGSPKHPEDCVNAAHEALAKLRAVFGI